MIFAVCFFTYLYILPVRGSLIFSGEIENVRKNHSAPFCTAPRAFAFSHATVSRTVRYKSRGR